ncbi:recombination regulator RecX [Oryzomicrobium terrae]|uniref:recombination regulator RecX n=1 Tax=Oryzomicrobium terrae TaxID=1735038 RepID=UPI001FE2DD09|nr:recombination regulator RecX [Oryzomicrobium terrae]
MERTLRERALSLLTRREHARAELARKLAPHAESSEELERLLDELAARKLLSDSRYAEMRVTVRAGRYGDQRLRQELAAVGVDEDTIATALESTDDELSRARSVWLKKFGTPAADAAARAKQMRFLAQRGFSMEIIRRVLRGLDDE